MYHFPSKYITEDCDFDEFGTPCCWRCKQPMDNYNVYDEGQFDVIKEVVFYCECDLTDNLHDWEEDKWMNLSTLDSLYPLS